MRRIDNSRDKLLGECLVKAGLIAEEQLQYATKQQYINGKNLEEIAIEEGWIKPETILYIKKNLNVSAVETLKINELSINIASKRIFRIMLAIICFFACANIIGKFSKHYLPNFLFRDFLTMQFNLDGELNLPSVYSALTLLVCSIILSAITYIKKNQHDHYTSDWGRLSILFAFLFFDELTSIHETLVKPVKTVINVGGIFNFAWVIPGIFFVLFMFVMFLKFLINLPRKTRHYFLIAGVIYVGGAIGYELVGGYIADAYTPQSAIYVLSVTLEESLEMLGIAVFIYGLLSHISYSHPDTVIKIKIPGKKSRLQHYLS